MLKKTIALVVIIVSTLYSYVAHSQVRRNSQFYITRKYGTTNSYFKRVFGVPYSYYQRRYYTPVIHRNRYYPNRIIAVTSRPAPRSYVQSRLRLVSALRTARSVTWRRPVVNNNQKAVKLEFFSNVRFRSLLFSYKSRLTGGSYYSTYSAFKSLFYAFKDMSDYERMQTVRALKDTLTYDASAIKWTYNLVHLFKKMYPAGESQTDLNSLLLLAKRHAGDYRYSSHIYRSFRYKRLFFMPYQNRYVMRWAYIRL